MCSRIASFPLSFHHLHHFITKSKRSSPIITTTWELEVFHRRFHLLLPTGSLTQCPRVDFGTFSQLRWLHVHDHALTNLQSLTLSHLQALETLEISSSVGWSEEKAEKLRHAMERFSLINSLSGKAFHVRNCPRLKRVIIGGACFCDYEVFEMAGEKKSRFSRRVGQFGGDFDR